MPVEGLKNAFRFSYVEPDGTEHVLGEPISLLMTSEPESSQDDHVFEIKQEQEFTFSIIIPRKQIYRRVCKYLIEFAHGYGYQNPHLETAMLYARKARTRKKYKARYVKELRKELLG